MFMAALIQFVPFQSYLPNKPRQFLVLLSFAFFIWAHTGALFSHHRCANSAAALLKTIELTAATARVTSRGAAPDLLPRRFPRRKLAINTPKINSQTRFSINFDAKVVYWHQTP